MIALLALLAVVQPAPPPPSINLTRPFAGMQFLLGHCWRGAFSDGKIDTHCFEPVYGGRLIRDRHEVTGGYEGETIFNWDANETRVEYTYWNLGGEVSRGTMRERDGLLDFGDEVFRDAQGRETRIATNWRRVAEDAYEVRITSAADPTGSRVVRYVRADRAPVRIEEVRGADGTLNLVHELVVPAPPADVYRAFATPDGWRTWAVPAAWPVMHNLDLMETSYTPGANPGDAGNIKHRFLLSVPDRLIVFRTIQTPPGFPHAEEYKQVTNLVELEPVGGGTRVRLSGIGYPAGTAGDTLAGFFREGNRASLEQLRARFESGPVDWVARAAQARR
jgi:uncharacterized protein YndB with AHSA1/START domain